MIVCPHPGPTNKADCLNWVFQGMLVAEQEKDIRYEIVVLHDSEDIVHPLELKLFNWLIPRKDMAGKTSAGRPVSGSGTCSTGTGKPSSQTFSMRSVTLSFCIG